MSKNDWMDDASCKNFDVNFFFDKYEEDEAFRPAIDKLCAECPVARQCFALAISQKATGVHGGVYLAEGKISREFNRHRSKQDWATTWQYLTTDREN